MPNFKILSDGMKMGISLIDSFVCKVLFETVTFNIREGTFGNARIED